MNIQHFRSKTLSCTSIRPSSLGFSHRWLQVRYLERQLEFAQQSSEVEGGAIEVLEGILRKRDTDKQLCHSLGLKSLEIGLKIRMLETDAGGKTVEVRGPDNSSQTNV